LSGARGRIIVGITHLLVVEPFYYNLVILKYLSRLGCGLSHYWVR